MLVKSNVVIYYNYYFLFSDLRVDTLSQILTASNVHAHCRMLVVETCQGLVVGALLSRMAGEHWGGFHLALKTGNFGWNVKRNNAFRNKPPGKCGTPPEVVLFFENSETADIFGSRSHCLGLGPIPFSTKTRKFRLECQKERCIPEERGIFRFK